jgi:hypothetical protein
MRKLSPLVLTLLAIVVVIPATARADESADRAYREAFAKQYPAVEPVPTLAQYASPARYDELYLGADLDESLKTMHNKGGAMAWGWSYRMVSLNEMVRATRDPKYLAANLRIIRVALANRDDRTGLKLFDGRVAPAWSSDGYRKGEQALFLVHTGMVVHPMLDAVYLARTMSNVPEDVRKGLDEVVPELLKSLACHDDAWRDGPGEGEGHYIMLNEEQGSEGKPQPGNRLAAMGRALYAAYRVTKVEKYFARTRSLARYIQHRLQVTPSGAYTWGYWLPVEPVTSATPRPSPPEDTSHGSLTMSFPLMLAEDNVVFTPADMKRFGQSVTEGVGRFGGEEGILLGDVGGTPTSNVKRLGIPTIWLQLVPYAPEVRDRIVPFYLQHVPKPRPIDIAYLVRFGAAKE